MKAEHPLLETERAAVAFAALGSEQRLAVLRALVRAGPAGIAIGALGERCGIAGSRLTFHLKVLSQAGLLRQRRQGRHILCAAEIDALSRLGAFLTAGCCADALPVPDPVPSES